MVQVTAVGIATVVLSFCVLLFLLCPSVLSSCSSSQHTHTPAYTHPPNSPRHTSHRHSMPHGGLPRVVLSCWTSSSMRLGCLAAASPSKQSWRYASSSVPFLYHPWECDSIDDRLRTLTDSVYVYQRANSDE